MFQHKDADRVPIVELAWRSTIERWRSEGMREVEYQEYFGLDRISQFMVDNSPRYRSRILEETEEYIVYTTQWGTTERNWKHRESVPELMDVRVKTASDWQKAKARMKYSSDRIPWKYLRANWHTWRERGDWIQAGGWFGFDITHTHVLGTERTLFALMDEPEWLVDMWRSEMELNLALFDAVWDAGYHFDALRWPDDMGYKNSQFFSMQIYRDLLKPIHKRAIEWAHSKGIPAYLHSCGDVRPFVPDLVEMGLDGLNPIEVKAGVNPLQIKDAHGERLLLHGGFNALLWREPESMVETIRADLPRLMDGGGYIFSTDHSVPSSVSLHDFKEAVRTVKKIGTYG